MKESFSASFVESVRRRPVLVFLVAIILLLVVAYGLTRPEKPRVTFVGLRDHADGVGRDLIFRIDNDLDTPFFHLGAPSWVTRDTVVHDGRSVCLLWSSGSGILEIPPKTSLEVKVLDNRLKDWRTVGYRFVPGTYGDYFRARKSTAWTDGERLLQEGIHAVTFRRWLPGVTWSTPITGL